MKLSTQKHLQQLAIANALTHWCPRSIDESVPPVSDRINKINETGVADIPNLAQVTSIHIPHAKLSHGQPAATWLSAKNLDRVIGLQEWKRQHHTNGSNLGLHNRIAIAA